MADHPEEYPPFTAEVVAIKGHCGAGHKVGDKITLGCWDSGGLGGFFYHDIFPSLNIMSFGGKYPWAKADRMTVECPDRANFVTLRIRKE